MLFADFARRCLVFHYGSLVLDVRIRESVRAARGAEQQAVALAVVARTDGTGRNLYQPTVAVLAVPCRNSFGNNGAAGILSEMNHLRTRVCLLVIVRYGNRIELADGIIPREDATRVFPCDGGTRFHLRP